MHPHRIALIRFLDAFRFSFTGGLSEAHQEKLDAFFKYLDDNGSVRSIYRELFLIDPLLLVQDTRDAWDLVSEKFSEVVAEYPAKKQIAEHFISRLQVKR